MARQMLSQEINIIEIVKDWRYYNRALRYLLPEDKRLFFKERARYITIDPDGQDKQLNSKLFESQLRRMQSNVEADIELSDGFFSSHNESENSVEVQKLRTRRKSLFVPMVKDQSKKDQKVPGQQYNDDGVSSFRSDQNLIDNSKQEDNISLPEFQSAANKNNNESRQDTEELAAGSNRNPNFKPVKMDTRQQNKKLSSFLPDIVTFMKRNSINQPVEEIVKNDEEPRDIKDLTSSIASESSERSEFASR